MINFTSTAPPDQLRPGMRLLRCPTKGKAEVIIVSKESIGCATHYWRKRTIPHDDVACEPCGAGNTPRWHAWVTVFLPKEKELAIFETTAQAAESYKKFFAAEGTLRGARLTAWRPSEQETGRVVLRLERWAQTMDNLPPDIDLVQQLYVIWGLHLNAPPMRAVEDKLAGHTALSQRNGTNGKK